MTTSCPCRSCPRLVRRGKSRRRTRNRKVPRSSPEGGEETQRKNDAQHHRHAWQLCWSIPHLLSGSSQRIFYVVRSTRCIYSSDLFLPRWASPIKITHVWILSLLGLVVRMEDPSIAGLLFHHTTCRPSRHRYVDRNPIFTDSRCLPYHSH